MSYGLVQTEQKEVHLQDNPQAAQELMEEPQ